MDLDIKKQKFIELRADEISLDKISKLIDISKPTLVKWCKEYRLEIHNQKSILIDSIKDEFQITREEKLRFLKELLNSVNRELVGRNLSDVPTDKLFKLHEEIKNELSRSLEITYKEELDFLLVDNPTEVQWEG